MNEDLLAGLTGGTTTLPRGNNVATPATITLPTGRKVDVVAISNNLVKDEGVTTSVKAVEVSGDTPVDEKALNMPTLAAVEKAYILQVLGAVNGNKTKAANVLGVTIKTIYNKLHQYAKDAAT